MSFLSLHALLFTIEAGSFKVCRHISISKKVQNHADCVKYVRVAAEWHSTDNHLELQGLVE
jgi:hypothetical protein